MLAVSGGRVADRALARKAIPIITFSGCHILPAIATSLAMQHVRN